MKTRQFTVALAALGLLATCGLAPTVANDGNKNFKAHLSGAEEVPPRETDAHGVTNLQLSNDGSALGFKLNVSPINNVVAAHIHIGAAGANGPVVAFLYGNVAPGGGRVNGRLSDGVITSANLVGPLAGQPLSVLLDHMKAGNAYVNVHTNDGVAPTNTGPGDFPGGEIRGQIE